MREGASCTYETQSSINSMKTVYAHPKEKQDVRLQNDTRAGHETVCRSALLRVGLSARPKVQASSCCRPP